MQLPTRGLYATVKVDNNYNVNVQSQCADNFLLKKVVKYLTIFKRPR